MPVLEWQPGADANKGVTQPQRLEGANVSQEAVPDHMRPRHSRPCNLMTLRRGLNHSNTGQDFKTESWMETKLTAVGRAGWMRQTPQGAAPVLGAREGAPRGRQPWVLGQPRDRRQISWAGHPPESWVVPALTRGCTRTQATRGA